MQQVSPEAQVQQVLLVLPALLVQELPVLQDHKVQQDYLLFLQLLQIQFYNLH